MDGIGWFTLETMPRMAEANPGHQFFFLFDRPVDPSFTFPANVTPVVVRPVTRLPLLLKFWNRYSVPLALKRIRPDLYISPDCFLPPEIRIPSIVTIHDLNFEHFPQFMATRYRTLYRTWVRNAARLSSRITTVSAFSAADIARTYGINPEKIDVVYSGLNTFFQPVSQAEIQSVLQKHRIGVPYFLVSGSLHPRKNPHRTIEAFVQFRRSHPVPYKLVFAGNVVPGNKELAYALSGNPYRDDIIFTGRITNHEMNALFRGASALLFASIFEGFGLPILEAAEAGIPVITSGNTSMLEIGGESSLLVNPMDPNEIAAAMLRITNDQELSEKLVAKSKNLIGQYTWDNTASLFWESILKV